MLHEKPFREIRLHSDKPPQEFFCDLVHQEEKYVVLRYHSTEPYAFGPVVIEKGSVTIAHYWIDRNYVLWKFQKPDASIIGYLFHIAQHVEMGEDYVRYVDLELDIWFSPDGNPTVLDEDEVKDYYNRGIFDDRILSWVEEQKMEILKNFRTILGDVWTDQETR